MFPAPSMKLSFAAIHASGAILARASQTNPGGSME